MRLLALAYPLVCLLLGTVAGSASWWREALMNALVVAAVFAVWRAARRERWPVVGGWFEPALALLFVVLIAGTLNSPCPGRSWRFLILFAAAACVFYGLVAQPLLPALRASMLFTAAAAAVIGLLFFALGWTPRVAAPLGHHNYMAAFLLLHLPLAGRALSILLALAIILTGSLAGLIVLAVFGVRKLASTFTRRELAPAAIIVGLLVLSAAIAPPVRTALSRATSLIAERRDPSLSFENRVRYLRTGLAMAADYPLAGAGLGSVPLVSAPYRPQVPGVTPPGELLRQLHDVPANLLAETGLLGAATIFVLLLTVLGARSGAAATAVWLYALFSLSDYQLDMPALLLPLTVMLALVASEEPRWTEPGPVTRAGIRFALAALALAGVILYGATAMAHWHYSRSNPARAAAWDELCGFYSWQAGEYERAAAMMPNVMPLPTQAGSAMVEAGQFSRSYPLLERAARLDHYNTLAYFHLGRARLHAGDRAGAVEAFGISFLVQPATVLAEVWRSPPESEVYAASLERALDKLYEFGAFYPESGPLRRWNELGAFLTGRRYRLPEGPHRIAWFELVDRDVTATHSLIVFRRYARPSAVAPVVLLSSTPRPRIPAGVGSISGLPVYRARPLY